MASPGIGVPTTCGRVGIGGRGSILGQHPAGKMAIHPSARISATIVSIRLRHGLLLGSALALSRVQDSLQERYDGREDGVEPCHTGTYLMALLALTRPYTASSPPMAPAMPTSASVVIA